VTAGLPARRVVPGALRPSACVDHPAHGVRGHEHTDSDKEPPVSAHITRTGPRRGCAWFVSVLLLLLLAGCQAAVGSGGGGPGVTGTMSPDPALVKEYYHPDPSNLRPGAAATICLDASGSYPRKLLHDAATKISYAVPELVLPGRKSSTITVRVIGTNTYAERARIIRTHAVDYGVAANSTSAPQPGAFQGGERNSKGAAISAAAALAAELARQKAAHDARFLRSLSPPSATWTDIGGCIQNASHDLAGAPTGLRWLIIASDMHPEGTQQYDGLRIDGTHVVILDWLCNEAVACDHRRAVWTHRLTGEGATSVVFARPDDARCSAEPFARTPAAGCSQ
jgi:hypothetical protein